MSSLTMLALAETILAFVLSKLIVKPKQKQTRPETARKSSPENEPEVEIINEEPIQDKDASE